MFGGHEDSAPKVVHVSSTVKLSGIGDDLLSGGISAALLASADSVGMDFDRMSTNAGRYTLAYSDTELSRSERMRSSCSDIAYTLSSVWPKLISSVSVHLVAHSGGRLVPCVHPAAQVERKRFGLLP